MNPKVELRNVPVLQMGRQRRLRRNNAKRPRNRHAKRLTKFVATRQLYEEHTSENIHLREKNKHMFANCASSNVVENYLLKFHRKQGTPT